MTFCLTLPVWGHRLGRSRLQQAHAGMQTGAFWLADTRSGASLCGLASPLPVSCSRQEYGLLGSGGMCF